MTPSDLDTIQALCDAATPGPWHATKSETEPDNEFPGLSEPYRSKWTVSPHVHIAGWRHDCGYGGYGVTETNAAFIAAARTALPALIREVRRVRENHQWEMSSRAVALQENDKLRAENAEMTEHLKMLREVQEEQIRACVGDYDFANINAKLRAENEALKADIEHLENVSVSIGSMEECERLREENESLKADNLELIKQVADAQAWNGEWENYRAICKRIGRDTLTDRAMDDIDAAVCALNEHGVPPADFDERIRWLIHEWESEHMARVEAGEINASLKAELARLVDGTGADK